MDVGYLLSEAVSNRQPLAVRILWVGFRMRGGKLLQEFQVKHRRHLKRDKTSARKKIHALTCLRVDATRRRVHASTSWRVETVVRRRIDALMCQSVDASTRERVDTATQRRGAASTSRRPVEELS